VAEAGGVKAGLLINATRVAIVGQAVAPPLFDTMVVLGQQRVVRACAMQWPVSVKLRARLPSKKFEVCNACPRSIVEIDVAGLLFSKKFCVSGLGGGGRGGDVQRRVESYCHRGQAEFAAAGL